ncbi:hypothetical protein N7460_002431 [Penicillium canescens]|uniref:Uncharacterized protein n=1 Tax=Penicillium canescens TaxID=5083 RepID=A0AAD6NDP6_PENCN|nr:hypothetical protein N7460_002431 [Penicillium canescens]
MYSLRSACLLFPLFLSALAKPAASVSSVETRGFSDLISNLESSLQAVGYLAQGITQDVTLLVSALRDVQDGKIDPVTTLEEALGSLGNVRNANDVGLIGVAIDVVTNGLAPKNILDLVKGTVKPYIPQKASDDAPYSLSEEELRSTIYIPDEFQYGANGKRPVLLIPGTANAAGTTYYFNYEKLLSESDFADPVWINIPGNTLADIQITAEYIAYAINYISGISQDTKIGYWPSTRDSVDDFLVISGEFHGSLSAEPCLVQSSLCTPAIRQQGYDSNFIKTLLAEDGDSAYVPTTSVYSGIDELVAPQVGPNASARLKDVRGVGVTNTQIQLACPGLPAGTFYTHDPMLFNPLVYALFVDALTHEGPADLSRVDLDTVCNQILAPGLVLTDLLGTEVEVYVYNVIDFMSFGYMGSSEEPPIKDYARMSS